MGAAISLATQAQRAAAWRSGITMMMIAAFSLSACSGGDTAGAESADVVNARTGAPDAAAQTRSRDSNGAAQSPMRRGTAAVIVRATGPSAARYAAGTQLDADGMITLAAGDRVVVLTPEGTRTLSGPGRFAAGAASITPRGLLDTAAGVAQSAVDTDRQDAQAAAVRREIRPPANGGTGGPGRGAVLAGRPIVTQGGVAAARGDPAVPVRPRAISVRPVAVDAVVAQPATLQPVPVQPIRPRMTPPTAAQPNSGRPTLIGPATVRPEPVRADPPRIANPAPSPRQARPVEAAPAIAAPAVTPRAAPRTIAPPAAVVAPPAISPPAPRRAAPPAVVIPPSPDA